MSRELDHRPAQLDHPAPFGDASFVSWPDPSPLQSWWDQVMGDHVIPTAGSTRRRGHKATPAGTPPADTGVASRRVRHSRYS